MSTRDSSPAAPSVAFGAVTVVLTLAGWASVPLFLRHFSESIDVWTSNGWRYGFSALVWLPLLIVISLRGRRPAGLWRAAVVPSIFNAVGQVCFTAAHYQIDPGLLTFGLRTQLVFVAIGAWLLFPSERPIISSKRYLTGIVLLIVGTLGVIFLKEESAKDPKATAEMLDAAARGYFWGVGLAILSGLLFACYGLSVRKCMAGFNSMQAFAAICQYTAAVMVGLMLLLGINHGAAALSLGAKEMAMLLLSALLGIAIGHVFYYISIARLGVAVTAGVLQLQPFLVSIASFPLFNERLSGWQWAGGSLAVLGAMLMLHKQWSATRKPAAGAEA